jgi:hypothetical protein
MHPTRSVLTLLVLVALAGCEREQAHQPSADTPPAGTANRPADSTADMVSAVSPATGAPVELKFSLGEKPQVGRPVDVEVAVLPVGDVDRIAASFQAGAGLALRSGEHMAAIENPESGAPINHRVTIVPEQDGIFFVSATVNVDTPTQSITRTFSIPIIAGAGVPAVQGGSAAPDKSN